jgi:hypothetical protein
MKTFTRFALAAIVVLSIAFMSPGRVAAQTTGGPGTNHVGSPSGMWFAELQGGATGTITEDPANYTLPTYPDTGHTLQRLNTAILTTSGSVGVHMVCFVTLATGGAIFWWEPTLGVWVPLANFQYYPTFDGIAYTCVNTWLTGMFTYGYVVP